MLPTFFPLTPNIITLLSCVLFMIMVCATILIFYRIIMHPLAMFHGPKLAKITDFYQAYFDVVLGGQMLNHLQELHERYGPVVRIGPNTLHFANADAYNAIYANNSFTKYDWFYRYTFNHCYESSVAMTHIPSYKARKASLSPLFSRSAIVKLEDVVQQKIDKLIKGLERHANGPGTIDIMFCFLSTSFDIIIEYCFATCLNTLDHPDFYHPMLLSLQKTYPHFPSLVRRFAPDLMAFDECKQMLVEKIDRYVENPELLIAADRSTIFHQLIVPDKHECPSKESLLHEGLILMGAGSDTVANACAIGTMHILHKNGIRMKLVQELREAWPDVTLPMRYAELEKLSYLSACIKESLRLSHGIVTPLPRVVGASGANICGHTITPKTVVATSSCFVHKDPGVFENPDEFIPERWLQPDSKELERYLVAFSKGPRMCIGINLAWCELYLILGNLFRKVNLTMTEESAAAAHGLEDFQDAFVPHWHDKTCFQARVTSVSS